MKQPDTNLVRLPVLAICGAALLLCALLIWWDKSRPTTSSTSTMPLRGEVQWFSKKSTTPPENIHRAPADGDFVFPLAAAPAMKDSTTGLLERVQKLFATGDPAERDLAYTNLLPALVKINPDAAAQFAESMQSDLLRPETLRIVAQAWASSDPTNAANWAAQLPDVRERNLELSHVCNEIATTDPAHAIRVVEQWGLSEHSEAVRQNIALKWAAQNFSDAKAWATAEPIGEERDALLARVACVRSITAPEEAAQLIVDQIPAGLIQTEAVLSVINHWGERDMAGAAAWVKLFPSGPLKALAEQQLSGIAANQNAPPESQK